MYFPISGIEVAWYLPFFAAMFISFFTSMSGISGAFLILPFQMEFLGYTAPSVSATNQFYNLIAIPSGILRYKKENRLLLSLAKTLTYGAIPGVILGVITRSFFVTDPKIFKLYAAFVLLYLACKMGKDFFRKDLSKKAPSKPNSLEIIEDNKNFCTFTFDSSEYTFKKSSLFLLSFIIAYVGGIYGIGGGAIVAPFLFSYFRLPVYITSGATLFCTFFSSCLGVLLFYLLAFLFPEKALEPDYMLGALFGFGGFVGMSLGARAQKYFSVKWITLSIICILLITAIIWIKPILFN